MPIQQITRVYARQPIFGVVVTPSHSIKTTENKKIMIKRSRFFITKRAIIDYSEFREPGNIPVIFETVS